MPDWANFGAPSETTVPTTIETTIPTTVATTTIETTVETTEVIEEPASMAQQFVIDIKSTLLGRDVSEAEVSLDAINIENGELTPADFVRNIINSEEFISQNLTEPQFITRLNNAILGGELGTSQRAFIQTQFETYSSYEDIAEMAITSSKFSELCEAYLLEAQNEPLRLSDPAEIYDIVENLNGEEIISTTGGYLPSEEVLNDINEAIDVLGETYRHVGFMLIDVSTGRGISYNIDRPFYSASAIKGPYAASLCYYEPDVIATYSSSLSNMLINSDNDAYTRLYRNFRRPYIEAWADEAHVPQESIMWKYPKIPTRDLFRLWLRNYQFFQDGSPQGEICEAWMMEPAYSLIHSELGEMYVTVSKAGWLVDDDPSHTTAVDAGIVYATSGTYIVVIESNCICTVDPLRPLMQALDRAHDDMMSF